MVPVVVNFFTEMMIITKKKAGILTFINYLSFDENSFVSDIQDLKYYKNVFCIYGK